MAKFIQEGVYLDHAPVSDVAQGDVVKLGNDYFGVATSAIPAGVQGAVAVQGVFEFDSTGEIQRGAKAYWNASTHKVSVTPADNCYVGRAVTAAAGDKCRVAINAPNIGEFTALTPTSAPTPTQAEISALTASAPAAITAKVSDSDNTELIADVTAIRAEVVKIVADLGTLKTAANAAKVDVAAVIAKLTSAGVLE